MSSEEGTETSFRTLSGFARQLERGLLASITLLGCAWALELHVKAGIFVLEEQFLAVMLGLGLVATFICLKPVKLAAGDRVPWYDWMLAVVSGALCLYVVIKYPEIIVSLSATTPERWILGAVGLLLVLEATRRVLGWSLIVLCVIFVVYARYADYFPGLLNAPPSSWERISVYVFFDTNGLLGQPLSVTSTMIISFILFGAILTAVKGGNFITDLSLSAMGRYRGGSAKVAVGASTLFGTMSGSSMSNVAVVGPLTIPLMRKGGYPAHLAAAVEATASTGGQIMPPVMGITAFLIADYLSISYGEVIIAALVPALLYYLAVFVQIDLEAAKLGLAGIPRDQLPRFLNVIHRGYAFLLPIAVLIYTIVFADWQPGLAGLAAAASAFLVGMLRADTRPTFRSMANAFVSTGRITMEMLIMTASAGVMIGALQISGVTFNFSNFILAFGGESIFIILLLTGFVSLILGIPLPTAVIYVMLAVLVAPALTQLGVAPIAAHLFLFYTGLLSALTPPVALSSFAAAAIARADMWQTSWHAMRYGIIAYIIPFVFPFSLGLLMIGGTVNIALSIVCAVIGVFFLGWGLVGYLFRPLSWPVRIPFMAAGLMVLPSPASGRLAVYSTIAGLAIGVALLLYEWRVSRRQPAPAPAPVVP
jgi:TRAP transporter 4TM/12TM fusion protein